MKRLVLNGAVVPLSALLVACAVRAPHLRPPGTNVEVEVLFDRPAHLVTTIVGHEHGDLWAPRSRARRRVIYLTLAPGGLRDVRVSQVFESLINIPASGTPSVTGATTVSGSCYNASRFEIVPGAEVKLRQHVRADTRCELACFTKQADRWHSMPCVP